MRIIKSIQKRKLRSRGGMSLVEMLVCTTILSLVAAGSLGMLVAQNKISQRFGNKMDAINAERVALDRISRDVREARSIGDVYGEPMNYTTSTGQTYTIIKGADYFPSGQDPLYAATAPPNGWPADSNWMPDAGVPAPGRWRLNGQTLIVQVPIFDNLGFPTGIAKDAYGPGIPLTSCANVETHVYRIVPSNQDTNPGEFQMEYLRLPGADVPPNYAAAANHRGPQVILKGIVGPRNPQGALAIFQYLDRTGNGKPVNNIPDPALIANYTGVVVNVEIDKHDRATARQHNAILGFKTEVFLRNNALATETATN